MRHSLLQLVFSEAGYRPLGFACIIVALALIPAKKTKWSGYVWLPIFALSVVLSLPALLGCVAGGYGGLAVLAFWPFPLAALILWFARPDQALSTRGLVGVIGAAVLALILGFVQRPGGIDIRIRLVDSSGTAVPGAAVSCFVYQGAGPNRDLTIITDANGFAILRAHWPEAGSIEVGTGRHRRSFKFQTASPKGGYVIDHESGRFGPSSDTFVITLGKEPNKAPEPTPLAVTIPACAGLAPSSVVAHLY